MKAFSGQKINVNDNYPIDNYSNTLEALKAAYKDEFDEHDNIYSGFGKVAREEGFLDIAFLFENIASIEKVHGDRFRMLAEELEQGTLFKKDETVPWMCTNCGYIYEGLEAPKNCPVCNMVQGYFILFRRSLFE